VALWQWMCECCECLTIGLFEIERQIKGFAPGEPKESPMETPPCHWTKDAEPGESGCFWSGYWSFECTAGGDFIASTTCWDPPENRKKEIIASLPRDPHTWHGTEGQLNTQAVCYPRPSYSKVNGIKNPWTDIYLLKRFAGWQ